MVTWFLRPFFGLYLKIKYGYSYKKYRLQKGKPYLILSNHQTMADQFLVSMIFDRNLYFIARDDLFSMGAASRVMKFLVAPIPKNKVARDIQTIRDSMQVAKEGGSIALFPEGNLTYSGTTEYIDISTAKYVKLLNLPVLFVNLRGGYGVHPRWAVEGRKGKMTGAVTRLMEPQEYKNLSAEELFGVIYSELYVDDRINAGGYLSKTNAECLESCIYVCPVCGISSFSSKGDKLVCNQCGLTSVYGHNLKFTEGPFPAVKEWYDYQKGFVSAFDLAAADEDTPLFSDTLRFIIEDIKFKHKQKVSRHTSVSMYSDRLEISDDFITTVIPFSKVSAMAVAGRNKLEISQNNQTYFLIGGLPFNALKYVQFYCHYKNIQKGVGGQGEFLGL